MLFKPWSRDCHLALPLWTQFSAHSTGAGFESWTRILICVYVLDPCPDTASWPFPPWNITHYTSRSHAKVVAFETWIKTICICLLKKNVFPQTVKYWCQGYYYSTVAEQCHVSVLSFIHWSRFESRIRKNIDLRTIDCDLSISVLSWSRNSD